MALLETIPVSSFADYIQKYSVASATYATIQPGTATLTNTYIDCIVGADTVRFQFPSALSNWKVTRLNYHELDSELIFHCQSHPLYTNMNQNTLTLGSYSTGVSSQATDRYSNMITDPTNGTVWSVGYGFNTSGVTTWRITVRWCVIESSVFKLREVTDVYTYDVGTGLYTHACNGVISYELTVPIGAFAYPDTAVVVSPIDNNVQVATQALQPETLIDVTQSLQNILFALDGLIRVVSVK